MSRYVTKQDRAEVLNRFALPMPNGCWEWQGATAKNGYGMLARNRYAHRESYYIHLGDLEPGKVIMHTCDNRKCINPKHLRQATQSENLLDMHAKGRAQPRGKQLKNKEK